MKLLVSSRLFAPRSLEEGIDLAWKAGFDGIEFWYEQLDAAGSADVRRRFPSGFLASVHAASQDINLTASNPRIASASRLEIDRSVEWAAELGAPWVVVHPGRASSAKEARAPYEARQVAALTKVLEFASRHGVRVAVENMERRPRELIVSPREVGWLLAEVDDPRLCVCLDTAHAATADGVDAFLGSDLRGRIGHIHVSNRGDGETHVPLDKGVSTITPHLRRFLSDYSGAVVLEGVDRSGRSAEALLPSIEKAFRESIKEVFSSDER